MIGIEIGSVSVKIVHFLDDERYTTEIIRHEGAPLQRIDTFFSRQKRKDGLKVAVTGHTAADLLKLPYVPETQSIETALAHYALSPDIILSLGGELFSIYTLKDGHVSDIVTSTKCAAGTGEFFIQQLKRMGLSLEEGLLAGKNGRDIKLSSRCSVHCKTDATHKLNKGECTTGDIAASLIRIMAEKICRMLDLVDWPKDNIVLMGGLSLNQPFTAILTELLPNSTITIPPTSMCLEAFGAALHAKASHARTDISADGFHNHAVEHEYKTLAPLNHYTAQVDSRLKNTSPENITANARYVLGIDAGSTTTKAALIDMDTNRIAAGCYLRTNGNPVKAAQECIGTLIEIVGETDIRIIQTAVTGSGRELLSVYLGGVLSFNEILAHGRAAIEIEPATDTMFEIGGQDSKYISFDNGLPIDYVMNDGCSAGTGSFLEETILSDLGIPVDDICNYALNSKSPVEFGEQCAAFINTDLRSALQQGYAKEDVVAGIVYSIAKNYILRVIGTHMIGKTIIFQGGVALNKAVALALAGVTGRNIIVPERPEMMGCFGCALIVKDLLRDNAAKETPVILQNLISKEMHEQGTFTCAKCDDACEIKKIAVDGKLFPFGGNCSRYADAARTNRPFESGRDLVKERNTLTFETFGAKPVARPHGTIGIPKALTTYSYYPFYAKLVNELGYDAVLSQHNDAPNVKLSEENCVSSRTAYAGVADLIQKEVDFILMPHFVAAERTPGFQASYICPNTNAVPSMLRNAFDVTGEKILTPVLNLAEHFFEGTVIEIVKMAQRLGIDQKRAVSAAQTAFDYYSDYTRAKEAIGEAFLSDTCDEKAVILAGHPYIICSADNNLALPQKIVSRGFHAVPADILPPLKDADPKYRHPGNAWKFTQHVSNAIAYANRFDNLYICLMSAFSCISDGVMLHDFRHNLTGETFCYIELDTHSSHVGFETRIGAFLDIVEKSGKRITRSYQPVHSDQPAN